MPGVAELLGQDIIEQGILEDLRDGDARLVRLTGPAGAGKSHIAREAARSWVNDGGGCVVAVGDDQHSWRDLYPLLSGLSTAHGDWVGVAAVGTRSALRLTDSALGPAGIGTTLFDVMTAAFRQKTERALKPYATLERDVILDLKRLARSRRLLLIADNAHWWDADSLRLVADVLSEPLRSALPQLGSLVVLLVDTAEEQSVIAPAAFEDLVAHRTGRTLRPTRCTRELFPDLLREFGLAQELPEGVAGELFSISHGHLKLAEQIAAYAEHSKLDTLFSRADDGYLSTLMSARFASLGSLSPEVATLLAGAAILGLSFDEQDLLCITDIRRMQLRTLIQRAESIGFIKRDEERITFSHEVIRSAILGGQSASRLDALYSKLSECLTVLRPGDYAARARALLQGGDRKRSRDLFALASVARIRRGVPASNVMRRVALEFPDDSDMVGYLQRISQGYASVGSGSFAQALPSLRTPHAGESAAMAAERNYLAAICSMGLQTAAGVAGARTILGSWDEALRDEVELRLRFLLLLQQAQVLSEMFDEARETELLIEQQLLDRARYDLDAAAMLQIQNRRAGAVDTPEIAETRIQEAVAFFRRGTGDPVRDRLELYRGLTNLTAIEIRLGKDTDAYAHAKEAERLAIDALEIVHRLDVLASNLVLAGYRSGALTLSDAIERQRLILESPEGSPDAFCQRCNLVAYLLLAGADADAEGELDVLGEQMRSRELDESYLIYYWTALSVAAAAVRGDVAEARTRHERMDSFVQALKWPCAPYVRRRQELLHHALEAPLPGRDRTRTDRILLDEAPSQIGRAWSYYGRLVPCCELSFWSDS